MDDWLSTEAANISERPSGAALIFTAAETVFVFSLPATVEWIQHRQRSQARLPARQPRLPDGPVGLQPLISTPAECVFSFPLPATVEWINNLAVPFTAEWIIVLVYSEPTIGCWVAVVAEVPLLSIAEWKLNVPTIDVCDVGRRNL